MYNIINYLKTNLGNTDITLYPGASDELIEKVEKFFNITLPDDIKQFYRFSDGFMSDEDQFRIVPLDEVMDHVSKENSKIYLAEYLIYCDMWRLEVNSKNCNDYAISCIYYDGIESVLTNSFAEFLERFLKGGVFEKDGLYDWHEEIRIVKGLPIREPGN